MFWLLLCKLTGEECGVCFFVVEISGLKRSFAELGGITA